MPDVKEIIKQIQLITYGAYGASGQVAALLGEPDSDPKAVAQALENTAARLERGAVELRAICERSMPPVSTIGQKPTLPSLDIAGQMALDVLLALHPDRLLRVSLQPPYKLCFLVQRADGWIDYFAVMPVPVGHEGRISQLLQAEPKSYIFLLPLEDAAQHQQITLARSHYFILRQGNRLRFYKGGEAGK